MLIALQYKLRENGVNNSKDRNLKCSKCGKTFTCKPQGGCWCNNYQLSANQLKELKENYADCLCEDCIISLAKKISKTT